MHFEPVEKSYEQRKEAKRNCPFLPVHCPAVEHIILQDTLDIKAVRQLISFVMGLIKIVRPSL